MAYQMKNSPSNKGTAAKPSPMRVEPVTTGILATILASKAATAAATAGATAAVTGGIGAISKADAEKKEEKLMKEQTAKNLSAKATENIGSKQIGTGSNLLS